MQMIDDYFERVWYKKTENNYKQAYVPEHASVFQNHNGTAPGFALKRRKNFHLYAGRTREMKRMFQDAVKPYLMKLADAYIISVAESLRRRRISGGKHASGLYRRSDGPDDRDVCQRE